MVCPAQSLLPLEAPQGRTQVRGLYAFQGRTVRFDGQGRQLDEDPDDKKRWN